MRGLRSGIFDSWDLRAGGLARPAAEKFAGAWLACFLVMARGDIFAHPSHFPPQWAEPVITAAVSAGFAIALWYAKRFAKSYWVGRQPA